MSRFNEYGLTIKQEEFCQEYIRNGGNATQAYIHAYNTEKMTSKTINETAFELMENPKISPRIEGLRSEMAVSNSITLDWLVEGLQKVLKKAEEKNDITNFRGCYMDLAKLTGQIVDKTQHSGSVKVDSDHHKGVAARFLNRNKDK